MGANKPFENVSCQGRIQNFFQGEDTKFRHFFMRSFSPAELILSNLSNKNESKGSEGMLPRKIFVILHTAMVILVLLNKFPANFVFMFLASDFECFSKYDAFCSHSFDYACLERLMHIVRKRFEIIEKFYSYPKHC